MVAVRYCTWECPVCKVRFTTTTGVRSFEVWCEGPDHKVQMKAVKEEYQ